MTEWSTQIAISCHDCLRLLSVRWAAAESIPHGVAETSPAIGCHSVGSISEQKRVMHIVCEVGQTGTIQSACGNKRVRHSVRPWPAEPASVSTDTSDVPSVFPVLGNVWDQGPARRAV